MTACVQCALAQSNAANVREEYAHMNEFMQIPEQACRYADMRSITCTTVSGYTKGAATCLLQAVTT